MAKVFVVGVLVLFIGACVAQAQDLTAEQVLDRMAQVYAQAEDYRATGTMSFRFSTPFFGTQTMVTRQQAVFQRPNRVVLQSGLGLVRPGTRTVVSNGRHVYTRIDVLDQYTRKRAPATLREIQALGWEETAEENGEMLDIPALLDGVELNEWVTEAVLERTGDYCGTPVYIVKLTLKGGHEERLWVGRDDFLIRRLTFRPNMDEAIAEMRKTVEASMKQMLEEQAKGEKPEGEASEETEGDPQPAEGESPKVTEEFLKGMMEQMVESFSQMEMSVTERIKEVKVNAGVPNGIFRFRLRPTERLVKKLDEVPMPEEEFEAPALEEPAEVDLTGKEAPDFTVTDLTGAALTLSQLRGSPVLLDFSASWCGPCRMELPHLQDLYEEYGPRGLQVIGLWSDATKEDAQKWLEEEKVTFRVAWLNPEAPESQTISEGYSVSSIPRVLLIDGDGIVRADLTGYREKAELVEALKRVGL